MNMQKHKEAIRTVLTNNGFVQDTRSRDAVIKYNVQGRNNITLAPCTLIVKYVFASTSLQKFVKSTDSYVKVRSTYYKDITIVDGKLVFGKNLSFHL